MEMTVNIGFFLLLEFDFNILLKVLKVNQTQFLEAKYDDEISMMNDMHDASSAD